MPGGRDSAEVPRKKLEMEETCYLSLFTSFLILSLKIIPSNVFASLNFKGLLHLSTAWEKR